MSTLKPSEYAARYLPIKVPGKAEIYPIQVDRYHIGNPTPVQYQFWSAVGDYYTRNLKGNKYAFLEVVVNGMTMLFSSREHIRQALINPFWGKGSPEDCQIVLQLAVKLGLVQDGALQDWANRNIGLDCNGFVGNYLFHEVMGRDWSTAANDEKEPGPKATIDVIFDWVLRRGGKAITDISAIDPSVSHVVVRVDDYGKIIPGGPAGLAAGYVGHIAVTEPGQIMHQSFVSDSMGGLDLASAQRGLYGKTALRNYESAGEARDGIKWGLHPNWMVFQNPVKGQPGVFEVQRDRIAKLDRIRLAPIANIA